MWILNLTVQLKGYCLYIRYLALLNGHNIWQAAHHTGTVYRHTNLNKLKIKVIHNSDIKTLISSVSYD